MSRGYEVVRKLAIGGMAELWLAHPAGRPHERVAIKRILPQFADDPEFVAMFLDEARIASELHHPNVVRTLEVGTDGSAYFIVMEYLDGDNVRGITRAARNLGRPLPLEQALTVAVGAARGLEYAHDACDREGRALRIVHRDVSPQNLFVTRDGAVKVVDFGIAKAAHRTTKTGVGTMKGKVPYMSPEQCHGEALDRRSDIWSLGAVLFELTVGRRLIASGPDYLMMRQIIEEEPARPSSLLPMYPQELESIVLKALSRRRGHRHQTMGALADELEAFARSQGLVLAADRLAEQVALACPAPAEAPAPQAPQVWAVTAPPKAEAAKPRTRRSGGPTIARSRRGGIEEVALTGRLDEGFDGRALGVTLVGDVVLDLAGVARITSFGVREWLELMSAQSAQRLFLRGCSEAVVNQLTTVRGFAGPARLLSFDAPFVCVACGRGFAHRVERIGGAPPDDVACPSCASPARYDDDPAVYRALAELRGELPAAPVSVTPIEKWVADGVTTVAVRGRLTREVRWTLALDGVEGELRLDLSAVDGWEDEGVRSLQAALRGARGSVRRVEVLGAPAGLPALVDAPLAPVDAAPVEAAPVEAAPEAPAAPIAPQAGAVEAPAPRGWVPGVAWAAGLVAVGASLVATALLGLYLLWPAPEDPRLRFDGAGAEAAAAERAAWQALVAALTDAPAGAPLAEPPERWAERVDAEVEVVAAPGGSRVTLRVDPDAWASLRATYAPRDLPGGYRLAPEAGAWRVLQSPDPEIPVGALVVDVDGAASLPDDLRGRRVTVSVGGQRRTVRAP